MFLNRFGQRQNPNFFNQIDDPQFVVISSKYAKYVISDKRVFVKKTNN